MHSHLYPEWYLDELRERSTPPLVSRSPEGERLVVIPDTEGVPLSPAFWSVVEKIRFMDEWGIEMSLLSPGNPWLTFLAGTRDRLAGRIASTRTWLRSRNYRDVAS
jgi:aminocarboxymuconate-semialdehyde decarboxylase